MGRVTVLVAIVALLAAALPAAALHSQDATPAVPSPPTQPASGPGGADYAYDDVVATQFGEAPPAFWLFEPAAPRAGTPAVAGPLTLVVFVNGCCVEGASVAPEYVRTWIDHLVRRGAVVLYPIYGIGGSDISAIVSTALAELAAGHHAPVDLTKVAVVGVSYGGPPAAALAASPRRSGLPQPAALMLLAPICCVVPRLGAIPTATRVLLVGAEDDQVVLDSETQSNWTALAAVPVERRAYVTLRSDAHGSPPLVADHFVGMTAGELLGFSFTLDALDWYGTWKLLDALMACSFAEEWCVYAFGDTPEQRFMGTWSDGVPVAEAVVSEEPGTPNP